MFGQILGRESLDFAINRENKENGFQIYQGNSSTDLFLKMLFSVFFQLISSVFYSLSKQSNSKNTDVVLSLIIIACCLLFIHLHEENVTVIRQGEPKVHTYRYSKSGIYFVHCLVDRLTSNLPVMKI